MGAPKGNKFATGNKGGGRPSSFKPEFLKIATSMCKLGATDADLADAFSVSVTTINAWKATHKEFSEVLKAGKDEADDRVERSLYQKAVGYEYDAVKIMQYEGSPVIVPYRERMAPDTTAAIFWLKNRRSDRWRDVHKHEHGGPGEFDQMSDDELRAFVAGATPRAGESDKNPRTEGRNSKAGKQLN